MLQAILLAIGSHACWSRCLNILCFTVYSIASITIITTTYYIHITLQTWLFINPFLNDPNPHPHPRSNWIVTIVHPWHVGAYHSWTKAFHTVKSVDISTGTIMFGEASMFGYGEYTYCSDYRFYIEGVPELELTPGSFRVIRGVSSSRLEYRPLSGEEFPQSVTVPVVSTLLQLSGVHNITMSNLILEHTSGGDCHSDPRVPACDADEGLVAHSAMVIEGKADTVKLSSLTFCGLGGFALFATNVASLIVERVGAIDVGSGGIFVRSCPGVLVNNSIVRNYGQRFAAGPGVIH